MGRYLDDLLRTYESFQKQQIWDLAFVTRKSIASNCIPGVGVGVLLAADSQSTSTSGYRASLWDP
jgi:hypothetical protein